MAANKEIVNDLKFQLELAQQQIAVLSIQQQQTAFYAKQQEAAVPMMIGTMPTPKLVFSTP